MKLYDNDAYRDEFMKGVYDLLHDDPDWHRANQIIDLFDAAPAIDQPENNPLTLDELRKMDGEPVFIVSSAPNYAEWGIVRVAQMQLKTVLACSGAEKGFGTESSYGKT